MRGAWERSAAVLPFGVLLLQILLAGVPTDSAVLLAAVAAGVLGAGLFGAAALARCLLSAVPPVGSSGPTAIHEHLRALARQGVPRLRDPDAAGHTRSRAPSGLLPAV